MDYECICDIRKMVHQADQTEKEERNQVEEDQDQHEKDGGEVEIEEDVFSKLRKEE